MITIKIIGCHDETWIDEDDWGMDFSPEELGIIDKLAKLSVKRAGGFAPCSPTIEIDYGEEE